MLKAKARGQWQGFPFGKNQGFEGISQGEKDKDTGINTQERRER